MKRKVDIVVSLETDLTDEELQALRIAEFAGKGERGIAQCWAGDAWTQHVSGRLRGNILGTRVVAHSEPARAPD